MWNALSVRWFRFMLMSCMVCCLHQAGVIHAQTIHVDGNTGDDTRTGLDDWSNAVRTISNGVARAATYSADTVLVSTGLYQVTTNIVVTNAIILRSWNAGALDPTNTVIDGQNVSRCLYLNHTSALVAGFTLTNGNGAGNVNTNYGGAVYMGGANAAGGTLSNCMVSGNYAISQGGGVYAYGSGCLITDCQVTGNSLTNADRGGGGVYLYAGIVRNTILADNVVTSAATYYRGGGGLLLSSAPAEDCVIAGNRSFPTGGGVFLEGTGSRLVDCLVSNNTQIGDTDEHKAGGGIYQYQPINSAVQDCTIVSNTGFYGGGIMFRIHADGQGGMVSNCTIAGNTAVRAGGIIDSCSNTNRVPEIIIIDSIIEGNVENARANLYFRRGVCLDRCVIRNNRGYWYGGLAIDSLGTGTSIVRNCLICGNTNASTTGVAGMAVQSNMFIESCTIVGNVSTNGVAGTGGIKFETDGGVVSNSIVMYNQGVSGSNWYASAGVTPRFYSGCTMPAAGLEGSDITEADPLFAGPSTGDFRLTGQSPCINAGMNQNWMAGATDLAGRPRIDRFMREVDMGCYEYLSQGVMFQIQ